MSKPNQPLGGVRVLVAEDNAINLDLCRHFLADLGIEDVTAAGDGAEALAMLESDPGAFDVILMDVRMPKLDGMAATREILARWPDPEVRPRIIGVTAHAFEDERQKCLDAGMDRCLSKPLRKRDLESALLAVEARTLKEEPVEAGAAALESVGPIDWRQFDKIVDDPESPCVEIFRKFAEGVPVMLGQLREAAAAGDAGEAGSIAHQLKGASSSFGFVEFAAAMKEIEVAAKAGEELARFGVSEWKSEAIARFETQREAIREERGI